MSDAELEAAINAAWERRETISPSTTGAARDAVEDTLGRSIRGGSGLLRSATPATGM